MARALPGSGAKCPSRVSRACGPGCRFVLWAGTGPRRAGSERPAVGEGSTHCAGTRLGAAGRAGAGGRVAGCLQGPAGSRQSTAGSGCGWRRLPKGPREHATSVTHTHSVRPSPTRPGLALPEGGCPLLQVPGGSRQLARVHRVPSSQPLGSLGAWMGHSHWPCPLPTTCLPTPIPSQTRRNQTCQCGPARASCGGQSAAPKTVFTKPMFASTKPHLKKRKE